MTKQKPCLTPPKTSRGDELRRVSPTPRPISTRIILPDKMGRKHCSKSNIRQRVVTTWVFAVIAVSACRGAPLKPLLPAIESESAAAEDNGENRGRMDRHLRQKISYLRPANASSNGRTRNCSRLDDTACNESPDCDLSSRGCTQKLNGGGSEDGGADDESSEQPFPMGSSRDPCALKSRRKCNRDRACHFHKDEEAGYCSSIPPRYGNSDDRDDEQNANSQSMAADVMPEMPWDEILAGGDDPQIIVAKVKEEEECPERQCRSPDGTCGDLFYRCRLNDPCATVRCGAGMVCETNYCGGCHAVCVTDPKQEPTTSWPARCAIGDVPQPYLQSACADYEFCQFEPGACNTKADVYFGLCASKGMACGEIYSPVCGCDGATYSNRCAAQGAGVNLSHLGACREHPPKEEPTNLPAKCAIGEAAEPELQSACADDEFCQLKIGECNTKAGVHFGLCAASKEVMCPAIYSPVCGCNGETYSSPCAAKGARVNVSHIGECKRPPKPGEETTTESTIVSSFEIPEPPPLALRCKDDAHCENGLVCQTTTGICICNEETNEGCSPGQICSVPPGLFCLAPGCPPMCTCDFNSDAADGTNGCSVGEVCREPCAIADAGPRCFASNEQRDCGDVWGKEYICADRNDDGVIDRFDGASGCVEKIKQPDSLPPLPDEGTIIVSLPSMQDDNDGSMESLTVSPGRQRQRPHHHL